MMRINAEGNVEVFFRSDVQVGAGNARQHEELSFSVEHFLLIAAESWNCSAFRTKLIEEAQRTGWTAIEMQLRREAAQFDEGDLAAKMFAAAVAGAI